MATQAEDDHLPIMSVADESGVVISTTMGHAKRLGRAFSDIIGHSCREWCIPSDWDASLANLQATIGRQEVRSWMRTAARKDGQVQVSWVTTTPLISVSGSRLALCSIVPVTNAMRVEETVTRNATAVDVVAYTADMLRGLADLAHSGGLPKLQSSLEMVAGEASRMIGAFRRTFN